MPACPYHEHLLPVLLSDKFYRRIRGLARHGGVDPEELVQIVAVRSWAKRSQFDPTIGEPEAWLWTMARHEAVRLAGKHTREIPVDPAWIGRRSAVPEVREPEAALDRCEDYARLADALERINPDYRDALIANYWEGKSLAETAAEIGAPIGTVMSRGYRGRLGVAREFDELARAERRANLIRDAAEAGLVTSAA